MTNARSKLFHLPTVCLQATLCAPCTSYQLRKQALRGDMRRYLCCQGAMPCSGNCGERCAPCHSDTAGYCVRFLHSYSASPCAPCSQCPELCLATEVRMSRGQPRLLAQRSACCYSSQICHQFICPVECRSRKAKMVPAVTLLCAEDCCMRGCRAMPFHFASFMCACSRIAPLGWTAAYLANNQPPVGSLFLRRPCAASATQW